MEIEFRFNGESKKKSLSSFDSLEDIWSEIHILFNLDIEASNLKNQDFELNVLDKDEAGIPLKDPSKQLFNGAIVDIHCINDEGKDKSSPMNHNIDALNKKTLIDAHDTDHKEEYPVPNDKENADHNVDGIDAVDAVDAVDDNDDEQNHEDEDGDDDNDNDDEEEIIPLKQEATTEDTKVDDTDDQKKDTSQPQETETEQESEQKDGATITTSTSTPTGMAKSSRYVVRLRGLPWSAREAEISHFFAQETIEEVQIVYLTDGRASGEALVEFSDLESFQAAFLKNRQHIGHRYIEIFKSTGIEIDTAAGRAIRPPARPPKSQYVIRMRGLPYSATDEDVMEFFDIPKPTGIHLIKDDLGRPSGEGFVEFISEVDAIAAMAKHRHHMGHRYIELFRSSPEELMRALGLTTGWYNSRNGQPQPKSTCILMRGLPYSCTESDITKFFQEIDVTPIRIHRKADGAEAYVEFYSISDTDKAMTRHRNYIGRRYIELFRVTYEDMARTVGLPVANTNIPASAIINSSVPLTNTATTNIATQLSSINNAMSNMNPMISPAVSYHYQTPHGHPSVHSSNISTATHSYHTGHNPHQTPSASVATHYNVATQHHHVSQPQQPPTASVQTSHSSQQHLLNINALMNPLGLYQSNNNPANSNGVHSMHSQHANAYTNNNPSQQQQPQQPQQTQPSQHKGNTYLVVNSNGNPSAPHYQQRQPQQYYQQQYYQ